METCSVVLTFESVDEILWCDHLNETSSAALLHGTICFLTFSKIKFEIFFRFLVVGTLGSFQLHFDYRTRMYKKKRKKRIKKKLGLIQPTR